VIDISMTNYYPIRRRPISREACPPCLSGHSAISSNGRAISGPVQAPKGAADMPGQNVMMPGSAAGFMQCLATDSPLVKFHHQIVKGTARWSSLTCRIIRQAAGCSKHRYPLSPIPRPRATSQHILTCIDELEKRISQGRYCWPYPARPVRSEVGENC
jgi:hypothetical protein